MKEGIQEYFLVSSVAVECMFEDSQKGKEGNEVYRLLCE